MRILTLVQYYLPGYRSGGPVRSIANLVDALGAEHDFLVATRDRDAGEARPYPAIRVGEWQAVGPAQVFYAAPADLRWGRLRALLRATAYDVLYLNSLFAPRFTLLPLLLRRRGLLPPRPVVLAPKGELSPGALALRTGKKRASLMAARGLGLYRDVTWQASTPAERDEIAEHFSGPGGPPRIVVAPDLPRLPAAVPPRAPKRAGEVRVVFASRIHEKKNLGFVLEVLAGIEGPLRLDVYGFVEDEAYARRCRATMDRLPANVTARWHGPIPHAEMVGVLAASDLFFLPTLGENYGHVIWEALAVGCPVLISDRTPWRGLEAAGAGWDLPLGAEPPFRSAVERVRGMDEARHARLRAAARGYAEATTRSGDSVQQHRLLFQTAVDHA